MKIITGIIIGSLLLGVLAFVSATTPFVRLEPPAIEEVYGEGWGSDIGEVNLGSAGFYHNISNFSTGELEGFTLDGENFTALYDGIYQINSFWSFSGTANNEYHLSISVNAEQVDKCHAERVIGTGGDVGTSGFTCLYKLNADDVIVAIIENVDSAGNPTIHDININLVRIDDLP